MGVTKMSNNVILIEIYRTWRMVMYKERNCSGFWKDKKYHKSDLYSVFSVINRHICKTRRWKDHFAYHHIISNKLRRYWLYFYTMHNNLLTEYGSIHRHKSHKNSENIFVKPALYENEWKSLRKNEILLDEQLIIDLIHEIWP